MPQSKIVVYTRKYRVLPQPAFRGYSTHTALRKALFIPGNSSILTLPMVMPTSKFALYPGKYKHFDIP